LLRGSHFELIRHIIRPRDCDSLGFDGGLLVFGPNWPFQGDFAILRNDLDVVRVSRKRFVFHDGAANFLCNTAVGSIHLLLVGRRRPFIGITLIRLGVVRRTLLRTNLRAGTQPQAQKRARSQQQAFRYSWYATQFLFTPSGSCRFVFLTNKLLPVRSIRHTENGVD
jgi:hypothetical protein